MSKLTYTAKRLPVVYGYARVSTKGQAMTGLSLDEQQDAIADYVGRLQERMEVSFGGTLVDRGKSAWSNDWRSRPEGDTLFRLAQPGDHIVVTDLTRAFRSMQDCAKTIEYLEDKGIHLHIINLGTGMGMDATDPIGKLIIHILAAVAQFESDMKSARVSAIKNWQRERGLQTNHLKPQGWKQKVAGNKRVAIEDWHERREMSMVYTLYHDMGKSREPISDEMENILCFIERRKRIPQGGIAKRASTPVYRPWSLRRTEMCFTSFAAELGIGSLDEFLPYLESITVWESWHEVWLHYVYRTWLMPDVETMHKSEFLEWVLSEGLNLSDITPQWWEETFGDKPYPDVEIPQRVLDRRKGVPWVKGNQKAEAG